MPASSYNSRAAADAAARRTLKTAHGASYMAKAKVDFIVYRRAAGEHYGLWTFDLITR